jgi:hypothetical protein
LLEMLRRHATLNATRNIEAKPSGGCTSPLERHAEFLLRLTVERPDMTLDEIIAAMARAGVAGFGRSISSPTGLPAHLPHGDRTPV